MIGYGISNCFYGSGGLFGGSPITTIFWIFLALVLTSLGLWLGKTLWQGALRR